MLNIPKLVAFDLGPFDGPKTFLIKIVIVYSNALLNLSRL